MEVEKTAGTSLMNDIAYQAYSAAATTQFYDSAGQLIVRAASQVLERLKDLMLWATPKRNFSHSQCTALVKKAMTAPDSELFAAFNSYADACAQVSGGFSSDPRPLPMTADKAAAITALKTHRDSRQVAALSEDLRKALAPSANDTEKAMKEILSLTAKTASSRLDDAGWTATMLEGLPDAEGVALTYLTKEVFVP